MLETKNKQEYISKSGLKIEFGFTETAIKNFLGEQDAAGVNPRYRSAAPTCLYLRDRVEAIVVTDEFQSWLKNKNKHSQTRSDAAKKAVQTKVDKALQKAKSKLRWNFPNCSKEELLEYGVFHYNQLWAERDRYEKSASTSDSYEFLRRITSNFLRHECSNYENILSWLEGQVGLQDARDLMHLELEKAIAEKYPGF